MAGSAGTLYVVATPIGNLDDISERARATLASVALIAAEDTRHSARLLSRLSVQTELISCHEHNESKRVPLLLERLQAGDDIALISDAGTPLVNDPGFRLVSAAAAAGLRVSPVPGCSAMLAALSVAGLPTDSVLFVGFLPASAKRRNDRLRALGAATETLVLFESVHRIEASLASLADVFGGGRQAVAARELTKLHETIYRGTLAEVLASIEADPGGGKGEYTLVIAGAEVLPPDDAELDRILGVLLGYLGMRQAADAAGKILGVKKNAAYKRALELREGSDNSY